MSGLRSASHVTAESRRCLIELTFQVAMRTTVLQCEAGAAAAGRGGLRIVDLERRADQIVDEIDLGSSHVIERYRIDEHSRAASLDHDIVVGALAFGVEFILKARASAAFDADAQHRAGRFLPQDFADSPRGALGYGDVDAHLLSESQSARLQHRQYDS